MEGPATVGGDSGHSDYMKKQAAEESASAAHPINVNGHSLKMGDLYSSHYDRKEMISKLNLMAKASGGAPKGDGGEDDMEPNNMPKEKAGPAEAGAGTDEPDDSPIEDQLFKGKGGK